MEDYQYSTQGTEQWRVIGGAVVLAIIIAAALWYFLVFREPTTEPIVLDQPTMSPVAELSATPDAWPTPAPVDSTPTPGAYVAPQADTGAVGGSQMAVTPSTPTGSSTTVTLLLTTIAAGLWSGWRLRKLVR